MPFSSISTSFIHIPSPVLENAAILKTPENSTFSLYRLILPAYDTKRSHFRHYRTKIREWRIRIDGSKKLICSTLRITWYNFFGKHHLPHYSKSHLLPFPQLFILYQPFYCIFNTIISILQYCYSYVIHCNSFVTILINTIYSYIYWYILSIKIYNS